MLQAHASQVRVPKAILSMGLGLAVVIANVLTLPSAAVANDEQRSVRVMIVSPEQPGVKQTGGLSHATRDLNASLIEQGYKASILMPGYTGVEIPDLQMTDQSYTVDLDFQDGVPRKRARFGVARAKVGANPTTFLRHLPAIGENYFDLTLAEKNKYPYGPDFQSGEGLGAFAKAAADYIVTQNLDVVILNDWTMGLVAYYLRQAESRGQKIPKIVFAIHNIAHQGRYNASLAKFLGLSAKEMSPQGLEFYGDLSMMKAGIQYSDFTYTVSSEYAKEITTPRNGEGLEGLMHEKMIQNRLTGILNGIITADWDPSKQIAGLEFTFNKSDLSGKAKGKAALQAQMKFSVDPNKPLFVLSSRLADQKGLDYSIPAIEATLRSRSDVQFIVIGDGDQRYADQLSTLNTRFPGRFHFEKFSNEMEKKLMRYGDFFINAPWFEPSGLNQFFAMANATIPIVTNVGGLKESIKDGVNGLKFEVPANEKGLRFDAKLAQAGAEKTFARAADLYQNKPELEAMRKQGLGEDHSWANRIRMKFTSFLKYVLTEGYKTGPFKPTPMKPAKPSKAIGLCEGAFAA